jgi:crotonobetainyl-CoA:carnitine CoA-transferase CaiB-like acyl-CoA transferase
MSGALAGLKVLDLSFYAPGRWASMVLADMGADVVCVEMPRGSRPGDYNTLDSDTHPRWFLYQRNKRSITLNLKSPGAMTVFERLAKNADVVIESYKPGTAERLGVDYAAVRKLNPDVVYCSVSGFGQTGPYRDMIGHEPNYQGLSGLLGQNWPDGGEPHMNAALAGDVGGGSATALITMLAAVVHRLKGGPGQYIDVAICAGIVPFLGVSTYGEWYGDGYYSQNMASNRRPGTRAYRTKDGKYVAISPSEPWRWKRFCDAIGAPDLVEYFHPAEPAAVEALSRGLAKAFATRTQEEWTELNQRENLTITPVLTSVAELERDPQMIHREMFVELDYEPMGKVKQVGIPYKMSETPSEIRWMPRYGQHTRDVVGELGFTASELDKLRAGGVCE